MEMMEKLLRRPKTHANIPCNAWVHVRSPGSPMPVSICLTDGKRVQWVRMTKEEAVDLAKRLNVAAIGVDQ